jgi:photosystem II stability/assembly factor-like uncharacterized protein
MLDFYKKILILIVFGFWTSASAQWVFESPYPTSVDLNDIEVLDTLNAWAVGGGGTLIKTENGGFDWVQVPLPVTGKLNDIKFTDPKTAYVFGDRGIVVKSTDGGVTWNLIDPGTTTDLNRCFFISPDECWVAGDEVILYSEDAGDSWSIVLEELPAPMNSLFFIDQDSGFIVGNFGHVLATYDKGLTWDTIIIEPFLHLKDILFTEDSLTGWIIGEAGKILKSTDQGATWSVHYQHDNFIFSSISNPFDSVLYVTGRRDYGVPYVYGLVVSSDDFGNSWGWYTSRFNAHLRSHFLFNQLRGVTVGDNGFIGLIDTENDKIIRINPVCDKNLRSLFLFEDSTVFVAGCSKNVFRKQKVSSYWSSHLITFSSRFDSIQNISFVDDSTGIALVNERENMYISSSLYKSTNGGDDWQHWRFMDNYIFREMEVVGDDIFLCGSNGKVLIAKDMYSSYMLKTMVPNDPLYTLDFVDTLTGWTAGEGNWIFKTNDGGYNWQKQTTGAYFNIHSIRFVDHFTGWVAGEDGRIFRSPDGGQTWEEQSTGISETLYTLFFLNKDYGWAVGEKGMILTTDNGGNTWDKQESNTINDIYDIFFLDHSLGWCVGEYGIILRTDNGGFVWTPESDLTGNGRGEYNRVEIFPNPFEHTTSIQFQTPEKGKISYQVFDLHGRQVNSGEEVSLSQEMSSIRLSTGNLIPGIYICHIKSSSWSRAFKLIKTR